MRSKILMFFCLSLMLSVLAGCMGGEKNSNKNAGENQNDSSQKEEQETQSFKGTIEELLKKNKSLKCDYSHEGEKTSMSGVAYVYNGQARQDTTVNQKDKKINTHAIVDGEDVYAWSSEQPKNGVKMSLSKFKEQTEKSSEDSEKEETTPAGIDESFEYNCEDWNADPSKFDPPKDINFTDMTGMMEEAQNIKKDLMPESGNVEDINPQDVQDMNQGDIDKLKQKGCQACSMSPTPDQCRASIGCE